MKKFFILLIFHHLAMAQIAQHFTVGQSDFFHIWDRIRDYKWITNESYQINHQILSDDGMDSNEMCFKHLLLLQETANSGGFLMPNKNWALKSRLLINSAITAITSKIKFNIFSD